MKALPDKNVVLWLVVLIVVIAAIAIYRVGFHKPIPGFDEEAIKSLELKYSETQTKPAENEPIESALQPSSTVSQTQELRAEHRYRSENPLYLRVVFGEESNDSMLAIFDESGGTGTGYNVAYVDENMNGDLTDETVKEFPRYERGSQTGELDPRVEFKGPFKNGESAKYTLYMTSLTRKNLSIVAGNEYNFHWFLEKNQWNYFFINGKIILFSNAAEALKGKPVHLGGQCKWEINARSRGGKPMISAGLKDGNGCTLRSVRRAGQRSSPTLTLSQNGKVKAEEKMTFG